VANVLGKLALGSRAQLVRWIADQDPSFPTRTP